MLTILMIMTFDGTQVNIKVPNDVVWDYVTPYGTLKIPVNKIRQIQMGVHVDEPEKFESMVKLLGSELHQDREFAMKFLRVNQRGAYKYLTKSSDLEVVKRTEQLLKDYKFYPNIMDTIELEDCNFRNGYLIIKEIIGDSDSLGKLTIKVSQIKSITNRVTSKTMIGFSEQWKEIGFVNGSFTITATGTIDLWPQGPGQYITGPKGHAAQKDNLPSGVLLGRINGGAPFVIGENYNSTGSGKIEVKIHGAQWPGDITGSYEVTLE